jgi:hypothetical protein
MPRFRSPVSLQLLPPHSMLVIVKKIVALLLPAALVDAGILAS